MKNQDTSFGDREEARKVILNAVRGIKQMKGAATLNSLGVVSERIWKELFGLADELRGRLDLLEETSVRYDGTFDRSSGGYSKGAICTHRGTIWHCRSDQQTLDEPGTSNAWQMMAKTAPTRGAKR